MKFSEFQKKIEKILKNPLPRGETVIAEGRGMASDISIGRTLFMDEMGVDSEAEYKRRGIRGTVLH